MTSPEMWKRYILPKQPSKLTADFRPIPFLTFLVFDLIIFLPSRRPSYNNENIEKRNQEIGNRYAALSELHTVISIVADWRGAPN